MASALIDTSFLLALVFPGDQHHDEARLAMPDINARRIVPAPVLPELFYMVTARMDYTNAIRSYALVRSPLFQIEPLTAEDMNRMQDIMEQYADNAFDYVDTAIMALTERLKVANIYSFDHVDFRVFRPLHRPYLRVLP
jgi:uncharacterized protein